MTTITTADSLAALREEFSALAGTAWLNCQGVGPGARSVVQAVSEALALWTAGRFDWLAWEESAEAARSLLAARLDLSPDRVAIVSSLAEAAATVAYGLELRRLAPSGRRVIVVGAGEFRSNLFPWLALQEQGFAIRLVGSTDGNISSGDVIDALAGDVGLVAVSDVQSQNGVRLDTTAILRACRAQGALLFVNTTQSAGVLRPATGADLPDFVAAHAYKWQLAPRGAAWLGVAGDPLDALRGRSANWKNAPDPTRNLYGGPLAWDVSARRLDASLAWFPWVGARAALELLARCDAAAVEQHALALASTCRSELERRGGELAVSELPTHLLGVRYPDEAAAQAEQQHLGARGIAVSARGAWLRIGFHGFNSCDELERLLDAIRLP